MCSPVNLEDNLFAIGGQQGNVLEIKRNGEMNQAGIQDFSTGGDLSSGGNLDAVGSVSAGGNIETEGELYAESGLATGMNSDVIQRSRKWRYLYRR